MAESEISRNKELKIPWPWECKSPHRYQFEYMNKKIKKKITKKFAPALIKEYGEQVWRDRKSTQHSYEDAAWSSVYVAEAVGLITNKDIPRFHKAIVKYAKTTKFPRNYF